MKHLLFILAICLGGFYIQSRMAFSESHVMRWISEYNNKAITGDSTVCDDFTNDAEVNILAETGQGHWEVEGGKDEMCGYLRQASAAFIVLQAQFDSLHIERGGFPWTTAQVKYHYKATMQADRIPTMIVDGNDTLILSKGIFSGLKIKSLESKSGTIISH
jgi:hypothetical protein